MPPHPLQPETPFVPRRVKRQRRRSAIVAAVTGVVVALVVVGGTFLLASRSDNPDVHLGDDVYVVGRAEALVDPIERDGPLLLQDLVGRDRHIYVHHLGPDEDKGWVAFAATAPGGASSCVVAWDKRRRDFRDPCSDRRFPEDGTGLHQYPATVRENGRVEVDLRSR